MSSTAFSAAAFAAALPGLRPSLLQHACSRRPCQIADAEDLVGEAVRLALLILPEYKPETGPEGLRAWLTRILQIVILRDRERSQRTVRTVPLEAAADIPAPLPQVRPRYVVGAAIRALPQSQRFLVWAWMDGHTLQDIARDYGIHRHTVSNRLGRAFHSLRAGVPVRDYLSFATSDFDCCSRVIVYHKPAGACSRWMRAHPSDARFRLDRRTRSGFSMRRVPDTLDRAKGQTWQSA